MDLNKPQILIKDTRKDINADEKKQWLETFEFIGDYPQLIQIRTREFSAVCPGTGLPDLADLLIEYIPYQKCVELKALKYYLFSYRDSAIFQEPVTDLIFAHLWEVLEPQYLKITMVYNTRGGFDTTTIIEQGTNVATQAQTR